MDIDYYRGLKVIKRFKDGHKSKGAFLLEKDVVKKTYDMSKAKHKRRFKIEITNMKHLSSCPFVPKLLGIDEKDGSFYMNYCGKKPKETYENIRMNAKLIKKLYYDWDMARKSIIHPKFKTSLQNTAILNGKMYVIDFGSSNWIRR